MVMIASGRLRRIPKKSPMIHPGHGSAATAITKPIAKRFKNAPIIAVPELDVSSCGETEEEARKNIQDAVRGFLETSEAMGTLEEILEEAGYQKENQPRKIL